MWKDLRVCESEMGWKVYKKKKLLIHFEDIGWELGRRSKKQGESGVCNRERVCVKVRRLVNFREEKKNPIKHGICILGSIYIFLLSLFRPYFSIKANTFRFGIYLKIFSNNYGYKLSVSNWISMYPDLESFYFNVNLILFY